MALGLLLLLLRASPSRADPCARPAGSAAALGARDVEARLRFLRESLRDATRLERRYLLGWSLTYGGLAAGTWALVPFSGDPEGQRTASAWNSATSLAAALVASIDPLRVMHDQRRLERLLLQPPRPQGRCAVLAEAERLLTHVAEIESGARGPRAHILGFFTTVGLGLVLGYALQRPDSAALNTTIGVFLTELMIATRPTLAIRRLESYRRGELSAPASPVEAPSFGVVPLPIGSGYGIAVGSTF